MSNSQPSGPDKDTLTTYVDARKGVYFCTRTSSEEIELSTRTKSHSKPITQNLEKTFYHYYGLTQMRRGVTATKNTSYRLKNRPQTNFLLPIDGQD